MRRPAFAGTLFAALLLATLIRVASRPTGALPALGGILDPVHGIWSAVSTADLPVTATSRLPGLHASITVQYDDRSVPHIFAASIPDAYRALGYVVARDRLFQMELSARAGAGTLTELVGARALPMDRSTRASGMPASAAARLARMDTTSAVYQLAAAYVAGANAFIDGLRAGEQPIEYTLLGTHPKRMTVTDVLHLLNRMGATLATSNHELTHLQAAALVGNAAADALYPSHAPIVEPIQPNGQQAARYDHPAIPGPGVPDSAAVALLHDAPPPALASLLAFAPPRSDDAIGSNNWAVAPERTASGHALLAGDPHLELTLPSIWYEAHLIVPDSLDIYGVTIPGAPGIIIGFTKAVSWTFTNTGADVMDSYVETVDDPTHPTRYRVDGAWRPLTVRLEPYRDARGRTIATDTLRYTHRGPMRKVGSRWISVRWTVLESMHFLEGFEAASRARSSTDLLTAMAQLYEAPAQNMLTADTTGTIAIRSTGRYPLRPGDGRGDLLRDGSASANDWRGDWPVAEFPQATRPTQGFLVSANQEPLDPRVQPRYLGANWERPWRAMQINHLLRTDSAVTPDAMRRYQTDPGSARAEAFVPTLLAIGRASIPGSPEAQAATLLAEWDRRYTRENRRAVLFEAIMRELSLGLWDEFRVDSAGPALPSDMMTAMVLQDSLSAWWDDRRTPSVEHRDTIVRAALARALASVRDSRGEPTDDRWRWDHVQVATINHLLGLPAFSRRNVTVQGGPATIWPSTGDGRHGPSWRMVVEMSTPRRAWGTYPGGQSGNPISARYDDRLAAWREGRLDTLRTPATPKDLLGGQVRARLTLVPTEGRR